PRRRGHPARGDRLRRHGAAAPAHRRDPARAAGGPGRPPRLRVVPSASDVYNGRMSLAVALLLPLLSLQEAPPSFARDARVTAAVYFLLPGAKPETDFAEMEKAGIDIALVDFPGDPKALDPLVAALDALVARKKD